MILWYYCVWPILGHPNNNLKRKFRGHNMVAKLPLNLNLNRLIMIYFINIKLISHRTILWNVISDNTLFYTLITPHFYSYKYTHGIVMQHSARVCNTPHVYATLRTCMQHSACICNTQTKCLFVLSFITVTYSHVLLGYGFGRMSTI